MTPGVKITVIDDRVRADIEKDCPFIGPEHTARWSGRVVRGTRCNVMQAEPRICSGLSWEGCPLQDYDRFIVELADLKDKWPDIESARAQMRISK